MVVSSILAFARSVAQTDSNGLTDANGIVFANESNADFHRRLIEHGVDASQVSEASITGVAGTGIYSYPVSPCSIIALKAIEMNYSDTSGNNYRVGQQVDISNLPANTSFSWLRGNQNPSEPLFDDRGDKFEVFPTPTAANNLTAFIRLVGYAKPSIFTSSVSAVNYPENLDPGILGYRTAANYLYSLKGVENIVAGDKLNQKYDERVKQYIETLGRGSQQPLQAVPIQLDGWTY